MTRRSVGKGAAFLASTTLLVTGCDSGDGLDLPGLPQLGKEEPDLERVRAGLRDEREMLDHLERVRRRHRSLRRPLAPAVAVHRAHVGLLGRAVDDEEDDTDAGASSSESPARVHRDPAQAVTQLVGLERSLAAGHVDTAMRCRSGVVARMVAAMSAAAAQQAVALAPLASTQRAGR